MPTPPERPAWPTAHCGACQGLIVWATTTAGDRIAVDAEPVAPDSDHATIRLLSRGEGQDPAAEIIRNKRQLFGARLAYRKHLSVCPHAAHYRSRARARREGRS
jgi:hypothetical protein